MITHIDVYLKYGQYKGTNEHIIEVQSELHV